MQKKNEDDIRNEQKFKYHQPVAKTQSFLNQSLCDSVTNVATLINGASCNVSALNQENVPDTEKHEEKVLLNSMIE